MPRSKHRRKPGGKAMKHPGRGKRPSLSSGADPDIDLWYRFEAKYIASFHERFPNDPLGAGYMLGLIADLAFVPADGGRLVPASKAAVFREFMLPIDYDPLALQGEPLPPKHETLESAEAALAFLVEQSMVVVTGDEIIVPAQFWSATRAETSDTGTVS